MLLAPPTPTPTRWSPFIGHGLTVLALAVGGLSSFHALRAEVVELRANLSAFLQLEAEHTRAAEAARVQLRDEVRELRVDLRELKHAVTKGADK
ncbi:MAG: hypothetical protein U0746_10630 [Gemmataceae bacterium]